MRQLFLMLLLLSSVAFAQEPLTASIKKIWTPEAAREDSFKGAIYKIDTTTFQPIDPNFAAHSKVGKKGGVVSGRLITVFSKGAYSTTKLCAQDTYYYLPNGQLIGIEHSTTPTYIDGNRCFSTFPAKAYKYSYPGGKLDAIVFAASPEDNFSFAPNGALLSHWIRDKCYKPDGSSCGTRQAFTEE